MKKVFCIQCMLILIFLAGCASQPATPTLSILQTSPVPTPSPTLVVQILPSPTWGNRDQYPLVQVGVPIEPFQIVFSQDVSDRVLGETLIETLWFNQATIWSDQDRPIAQKILELGLNPGMGVRDLHAQGITGKGVTMAIIDQPLAVDHPEYKGKIMKYVDMGTELYNGNLGSMHGPAVTSLLVGETVGTAPGARVYFAAVPSWFSDAQFYADALDWVIAENEKLPGDNKIRVVSVSAAPSGLDSTFTRNTDAWNQALQRATDAGLLVLDATYENEITSLCLYDLNNPDNVAGCIPEYLGPFHPPHERIYVPASHRSMATGGSTATNFTYQYTGKGGDSWAIPYLAGVLALGWQVNPALSNDQILELLYASAYVNADQKNIIDPKAFIEQVKQTANR